MVFEMSKVFKRESYVVKRLGLSVLLVKDGVCCDCKVHEEGCVDVGGLEFF